MLFAKPLYCRNSLVMRNKWAELTNAICILLNGKSIEPHHFQLLNH